MGNIKCLNCGNVYSDGMFIRGATNVTFKNVRIECPECGTPNKMMEGTFDFDNNGNAIQTYLRNANISHGELIQLRELLRASATSQGNKEQLQEQVVTINPRLVGLFDLKPLSSGDLIAAIGVLLTAIAVLLAAFGSSGGDTTINVTNNITNNFTDAPTESFSKKKERLDREKRLQQLKEKKESKAATKINKKK
jgi:hypothetical protein